MAKLVRAAKLETSASKDKSFYAEYDEDSGLWCVFGDTTGKAYASYSSKGEAEAEAKRMNKDRGVKASVETAAVKVLPRGMYFSKTMPKFLNEDEDDIEDMDEMLESKSSKYKAYVDSYNVNGSACYYLFTEMPKKIATISRLEDLIVAAATRPEMKGAKLLRTKGDGETAFLFKVNGGFVAIAFDND